LATQIVGSLLALEAMDETAPIRMYINSPGGTPYSIIGVVDAMQAVKPPIQTVALGACYSYSSLLLVRGGCLGAGGVLREDPSSGRTCPGDQRGVVLVGNSKD
jgi:ATP-dependent Clp protease protease subunit